MTAPTPVRVSAALWFAAVAAGVLESALAVAGARSLEADTWAQVGVRAAVYTLAGLLVLRFLRGRRWARFALTGLLTVLGLGSLVVPAVLAVVQGEPALTGGPVFAAVRSAHIGCVLAASVCMYSAGANRYFGPAVSAGSAGS